MNYILSRPGTELQGYRIDGDPVARYLASPNADATRTESPIDDAGRQRRRRADRITHPDRNRRRLADADGS
jgi:hypothetical protein